ncbi:response regulator [Stenomitos frigidus]|uniref:Multi-component transcriptional regulator n=1 Tax=Stenomitos frigidus ULC18 TaxID=2107698 RepID=A0A2T1E353_9CYAN|nr:response regulator [Stenomitos frigidus]PSB27183.1 hypothetical protein C7B82_17050 [Stenomitos frigidus ULC18]
MRILLVDDDELLTQALTSFLTSQHYAVDVATDGEAGWDYSQAATYDLIVLDISLPKLDGVRLCQKLRRHQCHSPILLLTAKGDSSDKVMGLDAGADDYLVKPCTTEELSARIRALLRRQSPSVTSLLEWGHLCLNPGACEVTYQGQSLTLSPKEYGLLELFLRNPQRVFSSSIILEHLWGFENAPGEETIRTHIKRLRQKLKAVGAADVIDTVYGMGYRLSAPVEVAPSPTIAPSVADEARAAAIALWDQFKPPMLERMKSLDQAIVAWSTGDLSDQLRQTAIGDAHKLAGSLGMFGFPEGSRLGQAIEHWLETATDGAAVDPLQALVVALYRELEHPPQPSKNDLLTALSEENVDFRTTPDPSSTPLTTETPQTEQEPKPSRSSEIKVLVVDDDALVLATLQQCLPRWGICPITLSNPLSLWDALERENPDLLILDIDMPHINGIEVCRVIRNGNAWNGLPILFLTAHRDPEIILQLYSAGADDYVAKPFTEPEVVTRIFNRLERNRLLQHWRRPTS